MTTSQTPWATASDEALADGEWHDGLPLLREAEKKITPGIALRKAQGIRAGQLGLDGADELPERRVPLGQSTLIAMGKRAIVQSLLHARVRQKSWEVRPWPLPENGWLTGGWQIRDLRVRRIPITVLANRVGIAKRTARDLVLQDPPIEHQTAGRIMYVVDVDGFAERVVQHRAGNPERRSQASRFVRERLRQRPVVALSLGALSAQFHIAPENVKRLRDEHPELDWIYNGRVTSLPVERLPDFEKIAVQWRADADARRVAAARRNGAARSARNAQQATQALEARRELPSFQDGELTDTYARYRAGETGLRDEVYRGFRDAFHRADVEAGEGE